MDKRDDFARIVDGFLGALARDERILTPSERTLLAGVLTHAKGAGGPSNIDNLIAQRITQAVGRAIVERALEAVGAEVVRQLMPTHFQTSGNFDPSRTSQLPPWSIFGPGRFSPGSPSNPGNPPGPPGSPSNPGNPPGPPGSPTNPGNPPGPPGSPTNPGNPPGPPGSPTNPGNPPGPPGSPSNPGNPPGPPGSPSNPGNIFTFPGDIYSDASLAFLTSLAEEDWTELGRVTLDQFTISVDEQNFVINVSKRKTPVSISGPFKGLRLVRSAGQVIGARVEEVTVRVRGAKKMIRGEGELIFKTSRGKLSVVKLAIRKKK